MKIEGIELYFVNITQEENTRGFYFLAPRIKTTTIVRIYQS